MGGTHTVVEDVSPQVVDLLDFVGSLAARYRLIRSVAFRALVLENQEAAAEFIAGVLVPQVAAPSERSRTTQITKTASVFRRNMSLAECRKILSDLVEKGEFDVGKRRVALGGELRFDLLERRGSHDTWGIMGGYSNGIEYFLHTDEPLPRQFVTPDEIERLGLENPLQIIWNQVVWPDEIVPPSPPLQGNRGIYFLFPFQHASIEEATLGRSEFTVRVHVARGVPLRDFELVITAHSPKGALPPQRVKVLRGPVYSFKSRYPIVYAHAQLFWLKARSADQEYVDSVRGTRADLASYPELDVHRLFDPDMKSLLDSVQPAETDSKKFEWAVATTLMLAGFEVEWLGFLGKQWKSGEVDIICYLPHERKVVLAECCLDLGDIRTKLAVLRERSAVISKILDTWEIRRVLFTTRALSAFSNSMEAEARELDVAIVPSDVIREYIRAIRGGFSASQLFQTIHSGLLRYAPTG